MEGKPVVVLSNNDGCVVSRSNEAKALGVLAGAPWFRCAKLVEGAGGCAFSSNYELYGDMSRRVMHILAESAPMYEQYSIDEAFLQFDASRLDEGEFFFSRLRTRVLRETGIPVSIGIGSTRTLAKLANRLAKQAANGVHSIPEAGADPALMTSIPVTDVWGIGAGLARRLAAVGIRTASDLAAGQPAIIRRLLGVTGERTLREMNGEDCSQAMPESREVRQTVSCSRTFSRAVMSLPELTRALAGHVSIAAAKLRAAGLVAGQVAVYLATDRYVEGPQQAESMVKVLPRETGHTPHLVKEAVTCLQGLYRHGYAYRKLGVLLSQLVPVGCVQPSLFVDCGPGEDNLMTVMDSLNARYGRGTLALASALPRGDWAMARRRLSQRWTTSWDEIPLVQ
jgi:DNA polymerase V